MINKNNQKTNFIKISKEYILSWVLEKVSTLLTPTIYKGKYDCRIMLHAYFLYFIHPKTKEQIFVKAPLMEDFKNIMFEQINLGENDEKISLEFLLEFFNSFA